MLYTSCTCKFYCVIGLSMRDALRIAKCQLYSGEWVINTSSWCIACIVYYTLTGYAGMSRWKRYKALGVRKRYVVWQWMTDTGSSCIVLKMHITRTEYTWRRTVQKLCLTKKDPVCEFSVINISPVVIHVFIQDIANLSITDIQEPRPSGIICDLMFASLQKIWLSFHSFLMKQIFTCTKAPLTYLHFPMDS